MKNNSSLHFDVNSNKKFISEIPDIGHNTEIYFVGNF